MIAAGDSKNWTNPSRLLLLQIESLAGASPLIVAPPDDGFAAYLAAKAGPGALVHNFDFRSQRFHRKKFLETGLDPSRVGFGEWHDPQAPLHDSVIVFLPKGRDLIEYVLRMAAQSIVAGGFVYLVGGNNEGIRSARGVFSEIVGDVVWSEAARHSVVFAARATSGPQRVSPQDFLEDSEFELEGSRISIRTLPGVFSRGRLDDGTKFLLEKLPALTGRILDFGCGCGIIGAAIKRRSPESVVELLDSSALAVRSAELTFETNAIVDAKIFASDGFSEVEGQFDAIISNPPFHRGVGTDYQVVEQMIRSAKNYLNPGGNLFIVANRFLKYKQVLDANFQSSEVLAENNAYRVYQAN